jgi:hypothetical protein
MWSSGKSEQAAIDDKMALPSPFSASRRFAGRTQGVLFWRPVSRIDGAKEKRFLSTTSQRRIDRWLAENGPKELESLFRAIVFQPSVPILIADNDRRSREASVGASRL